MADQFDEVIKLQIDNTQAKKVETETNASLTNIERQAIKTNKAIGDATDQAIQRTVTITQTSQRSINSTVAAAERRAAFTGLDPLQTARLKGQFELKKVAGDQEAVRKVTAATTDEVRKLNDIQRKVDYETGLNRAVVASKKATQETKAFEAAVRSANNEAYVRRAQLQSVVEAAERRAASVGATPIQQAQIRGREALSKVAGNQDAERQVIAATTLEVQKLTAAKEKAALLDRAVSASKYAQTENAAFLKAEASVQAAAQKASSERQKALDQEAAATAKREAVIRATENRAETAGLKGSQILAIERDRQIALAKSTVEVNRLQASYARLIKIELEEEARNASHGIFSRATPQGRTLLGVKDLFEGRTTYAEAEFATAALSTGGATLALAAGATAFAAVAAGIGYATSKLGEFSRSELEVQQRTGLTAQELGSFGFAARVAGSDITEIDNLMRGLTKVFEDTSPAGDRARKTLDEIGVHSLVDIQGNAKKTGPLLLEISAAFNKIPPGTKLSADAIDLFNRVGVNAIPLLRGLRDNAEYFDSNGFPAPKQAELDRWEGYNKKVQVVKDSFRNFFYQDVLDPLAKAGELVGALITALGELKNKIPGGNAVTSGLSDGVSLPRTLLDAAARIVETRQAQKDQAAKEARDKVAQAAADQQRQAVVAANGGQAAFDAANRKLNSYLNSGDFLEGAQRKLTVLKDDYDKARLAAENLRNAGALPKVVTTAISEVESARRAYDNQKELVKVLEERPAAEKAAADAAIESNRKYQDELERSRLEALGVTDAEVTGYLARKKALDEYDAARAKSKEAGQGGDKKIATAQFNTFNTAILSANLQAIDAERREKDKQLKLDLEDDSTREKQSITFNRETSKLLIDSINQRYAYEDTQAAQFRDKQLRGLEALNAQTLSEKLRVEQAKADVEDQYTLKSAEIQRQSVRRNADDTIETLREMYDDNLIQFDDFVARRDVLQTASQKRIEEITLTSEAEIQARREQLSINASKAIIQQDRELFDRFKSEANGLFDQLFTKGQNVFQALGNTLKTAFLTAFKDIVSSRIAATLTELVTGQKVELKSATPVGNTPIARIAARLGLGAIPVFGGSKLPGSHLDLPNHLGDTVLRSGAVPVYVANFPSTEASSASAARSEQIITRVLGGNGSSTYDFRNDPTLIIDNYGSKIAKGVQESVQSIFTPAGSTGASPSGEFASSNNGNAGGFNLLPSSGPASRSTFGGIIGAAAGLLGALGIASGSSSSGSSGSSGIPSGAVSSRIDFGGGFGSESSPTVFGSLGRLIGGPGGTTGFGGNVNFGSGSGASQTDPGIGILQSVLGLGSGSDTGFAGSGGGILGTGTGATAATAKGGFLGKLASLGTSLGKFGGFKNILGGLTSLGNIGIGGASSLPISVGSDTASTAASIPGLGGIAPLKVGGLFAGKVGGAAGGALLAGGGILLADGLHRGGFTGLGEDIAGGAAVGLKFGGPIGALIGAGVGAVAGTARLFIKGFDQQVVDQVKSTYGISITKQYARNALIPIIKQKYGGAIHVGIRSPEVRQLIEAYAAGTSQQFTPSSTIPRGASLVETGGKLYQDSTTVLGKNFVLPSSLPTIGSPAQTYAVPGGYGNGVQTQPQAISLQLNVDGKGAGDFFAGQVVTPEYVANSFNQGTRAGSQRQANSALIQQPGLLTS